MRSPVGGQRMLTLPAPHETALSREPPNKTQAKISTLTVKSRSEKAALTSGFDVALARIIRSNRPNCHSFANDGSNYLLEPYKTAGADEFQEARNDLRPKIL
jgi:hypothetical protein